MLEEKYKNAFEILNKDSNDFININGFDFNKIEDFYSYLEDALKSNKKIVHEVFDSNKEELVYQIYRDNPLEKSILIADIYEPYKNINGKFIYAKDLVEYLYYHAKQWKIVSLGVYWKERRNIKKSVKKHLKSLDLTDLGIKNAFKELYI